MAIPQVLRYEAQLAQTGRARCKICGALINKGEYMVKILGFRINQSLHPDCLPKLVLLLIAAHDKLGLKVPDKLDHAVRAEQGVTRVGSYQKGATGKFSFRTMDTIKHKEGGSNV